MISTVTTAPLVGEANRSVRVEWRFGYDVVWTPTTNDELRLLTTTGVLVSRVSLRSATPLQDGGSNQKHPSTLREAWCNLVCGAFGGSFVLAFLDCTTSFRRVYTVPFRVIGPLPTSQPSLHLCSHDAAVRAAASNEQSKWSINTSLVHDVSTAGEVDAVEPLERLTIRYDRRAVLNTADGANLPQTAATSSLRFVVCRAQQGDNLGCNAYGVGPYDHCVSVARVPAQAFDASALATDGPLYGYAELVAPDEEGSYEVRLMATPPSGVPYSVATSAPFDVVPPSTDRLQRVGRLHGTLDLSTYRCVAGEQLTLTYHVLSPDTQLLSRFDTIAFSSYGRTESIRHAESMHATLHEVVGRKTVAVRAPAEPGRYDVSLYSFSCQQPVLLSKPLTVLEPRFVVELIQADGVKSVNTLSGKAAHTVFTFSADFRVSVSAALYHPRDRITMVDENANVVCQAAVVPTEDHTVELPELFAHPDYEGTSAAVRHARASLHHPIPGKYTVHYFSFTNDRFMYQAPLYLEFRQEDQHVVPTVHIPSGAMSIASKLPLDEPIEVMFLREGADSRSQRLQLLDCVCLYLGGAPDAIASRFVDDSVTMPCLAVHHLRGATSDHILFPSVRDIAEQISSSLMSASGDATISGSHTAVTARGCVNSGSCARPSLFTAELLHAVRSASTFSVRYMLSLDENSLLRVCATQATVNVMPRPAGYRVAPLRHVAPRELAQLVHRFTSAMVQTDSDFSISSTVTPVALSRRSAATPHAANKNEVLRVIEEHNHEFRGAVLAPAVGVTTEPLVVTFHVTSGVPRGTDRLVLFNVGGTSTISECAIGLATESRPDLTLGTLVLRPPALEGSYYVGYFSELYGGVVLVSQTIRVAAGDSHESGDVYGAKPKRAAPRCIGGNPTPRHTAPSAPTAASSLTPSQRLPRCKVLIAAVSYLQQPHELKGPLNDAEAFRNLSESYFYAGGGDENSKYPASGAPASGLGHLFRVLHEATDELDKRPTADNIRNGFSWLVEDQIAGDQLVFYFSGAGSTVPGTNERCLLPVDFDWALRVVTHTMILQELVLKSMPSVNCCVFLDACYYPTPLECFRRGELRLLKSGEEGHLGWMGLQRRRRYTGVGTAPWRCVPQPKGTSEENFGAMAEEPLHIFASVLEDVSRLHAPSSSRQQSRPLAVMYEASRGSHGWSDGAWDVFLRESSLTRGLFSHFLCSVLQKELDRPHPSRHSLCWAELHETVTRAMDTMSYRQSPRLWVGSRNILTVPVRYVDHK